MSDERENLPSASGVEAMTLCRGKWALESTVPRVDDSSEESRSGDRIHAFMAGLTTGGTLTLSDDEERVAEKFKREEADLINEFVGESVTMLREERLWLRGQDGDHIFSGKPDAVFIGENAILIEDYKSGWLGATPAPHNPQLRALVVLVNQRFRAMGRPIYAAALLRSGKPSVARYEAEDIAAAEAELRGIIAAGMDPLAPRTPGEHQCRYCRAIAVCPEAAFVTTALAVLDTRRELDTTDLVRLLDICGPAEKVIGSIRAAAKRRLEADPASVPGWVLAPGSVREKIVDVRGVFERVSQHGITADQFTAACSLTKTSLKETVKAATGAKGAKLDALVKEAVAGLVESKVTAPSLERA